MENTRRYILAIVTLFTFICCSAGENNIKEEVQQRKLQNNIKEEVQQRKLQNNIKEGVQQLKLRAPLIYKLQPSGYSGTVRIICIATGKPNPEVTWTFNDVLIDKNSHYDYKYENQSMLVIKDTTDADSGKYKCHASNFFGKIFQELSLKIKGVGKFKEGFRQEDECQYRNVTVGRPYGLACPPHSNEYGQEFKWVVNPLDVWKPGYPIDRLFQAPNGSLVFSYVKKSDIKLIDRKGGLSCGLVIEFKIVPSVSIKFFDDGNEFKGTTKPTITVFMKKRTEAVAGTSVKLLCGAIGKPHPELTWLKDDRRIYFPLDGMLTRDVIVEGKGMVIHFRSVRAAHAGTYRCIAVNSAGKDARVATMIVNSHVRWKRYLPLHIHLQVMDSIKLQCIAEGKPKPAYTWMHNETVIKATSTRKIKNGLLQIPSVDFTDGGFYLCIAENILNKIVTASYVNVQAFPPLFVTPFKEMNYFFTGTRNTLHCDVTAGPAPAIQWYHNDISVVGGNKGTIGFVKTNKTLNGVYKCVASNIEGNVESSTLVKVFDETRITKGPANFTFEAGSVANLFCEAEYDNTIRVTLEWLKNGKLLTYDSRINLKKGITWSSTGLQINDLVISDAGAYTCRVFTEDDTSFHSQDEKTGSITIMGTPEKPQDLKLVGDCGKEEIVLTWSAPSEYIGPVSYYITEYSDVNNSSKWYVHATPSEITGTSLTIKTADLPPSSTIMFRVKAVSDNLDRKEISRAREGTQIQACTVGSGVPFVAPMGLKVVMDSNENLTVSWDKFDEVFQSGKEFEIVGAYKEIVNGTVVDAKQVKVKGDDTSFKIPIGSLNEKDDGKYEIEVWGENQQGAGPKAKIITEHPGNLVRPLKVGNVQVVSVTDTSVTLKWDEINSASRYVIYHYDPKSGRRRRVAPTETKKALGGTKVTDRNNGTIVGLTPNRKYEVTVAAQNVKGEGPESDVVEVETRKRVPGIPKDVNLETYGKAIALTWSSPEEDNVTGYDVTWYPSDEIDPTKTRSKKLSPDTQRAFITSDLEPLTYYTVELNAQSDAGKGKPWKMVGVVVGKPDLPGKPDPPSLFGLNISTINVIFHLPTKIKNRGGLPNKFHVYYVKEEEGQPDNEKRQRKGQLEKKVSVAYPRQTSVILFNLELATYIVWTAGENSKGEGIPSEKVNGMPLVPETTPPCTTTALLITTPNMTVNITAQKAFFLAENEFYSELWFIILIALILLILLIALIICAIMNNGHAGQYPVGLKEKEYGGWDNNQQLQDYSDNPMDKPNGMPFKYERIL